MNKLINLLFLILSFKGFSAELSLSSCTFKNNQAIPKECTCKGDDIQPTIHWRPIPHAKSYALIMDDPDAPSGDWVHWIVYNISGNENTLSVNHPYPTGKNSWGNTKYQGPCPPIGTHHYYLKLYALDKKLNLDHPDKKTLIQSMEKHIIHQSKIMGTFGSQ
jgi:Raf kinase inhibitor-like YbhB/YbcL family protein